MESLPETTRSERDSLLGREITPGDTLTHRSTGSIFSSWSAFGESLRRPGSWRPLSWRPLIASRHTLGLVVTVFVLLGVACSVSWISRSFGTDDDDLNLNPVEYDKFVQAMYELEQRIQGNLVWPSDGAVFVNASHVWNQCFRGQPPAVVIEVADEADVQIALPVLGDIQKNFSIPFRIRSGGHSYAGWSTVPNGIILSLSSLSHLDFQLDDSEETAIVSVGPAVRARDILEQVVVKHGFGSVIGSCPDVAEGGYTLGGGQGGLARAYGLAIDSLKEARVVLADGKVVTTSATEHPDLFWALRGAGQGNFGVVTEMKFTYYPTNKSMLLVKGTIPLHLAYEFLTKFGTSNPPVWAGASFQNVHMQDVGVSNLPLFATLWWNGDDMLQGQTFWNTTLRRLLPSEVVDAFTFETIPWYDLSTQDFSANEELRVRVYNGFLYPKHNTPSTWQYIMDHLWIIAQQTEYGSIVFEYWGGNSTFNAMAPNATAFYWRDAVYNVRLEMLVPADLGPEEFESQQSLFDSQWVFVQPYLTGSYANYPQASLDHPSQTTYGGNLQRLKQIKRQYDPANVFRHPHGIPLSDKVS